MAVMPRMLLVGATAGATVGSRKLLMRSSTPVLCRLCHRMLLRNGCADHRATVLHLPIIVRSTHIRRFVPEPRREGTMHSDSIHAFEHGHMFLGEKHEVNERRTWFVVALTAAMMVAEIAGGIVYGSMALVADGWHMSTHAAALSISALAYRFARRHARDPRFSLGTGSSAISRLLQRDYPRPRRTSDRLRVRRARLCSGGDPLRRGHCHRGGRARRESRERLAAVRSGPPSPPHT